MYWLCKQSHPAVNGLSAFSMSKLRLQVMPCVVAVDCAVYLDEFYKTALTLHMSLLITDIFRLNNNNNRR